MEKLGFRRSGRRNWLYDENIERIHTLIDKNEREIAREYDFIGEENRQLLEGIDERLNEYVGDPRSIAKSIVDTIRHVRSSVSYPTAEKFNADDLLSSYNVARYIVQGKGYAKNIYYSTTKQDMNKQIYALAMEYLQRTFLSEASDPNVGFQRVGAPTPGSNIYTIGDTKEKKIRLFLKKLRYDQDLNIGMEGSKDVLFSWDRERNILLMFTFSSHAPNIIT